MANEGGHEKFIAVDPEAYIKYHFRINPALRYGMVDSVAAMSDEYLLFVMHCNNDELLIISTKRILIYKIPVKTSWAQRFGAFVKSVAIDNVVGNIPIVSEASTLIGSVDAFKSVRDRIMRGKEMPLKKDAIITEWDLKENDIRLLVVIYTDKILLENGWYWKKTLEISAKQIRKKRAEISIGSDGINGKIGGKNISISFVADPDTNFNYPEIARILINQNIEAFGAAGWQANIVDGRIILKK